MISMGSAQAGLDAILAKLNVGGAGSIKIFTGSMPVTCETADTGTLLSSGMNLSSTAFAASTDNGDGTAKATANAISTDTNAAGTGTAGYFRAYPHTPTTTNAVIQGTVGTSSADMILNSTSIVAGGEVSITSWTVQLPDGSGAD
jgi:hypothetical protein